MHLGFDAASIFLLRTRTKDPGLKSKSQMMVAKLCLKSVIDATQPLRTCSCTMSSSSRLAAMNGYEVNSFKMLRNLRDNEGGFRNVEWKEGIDTMVHVVWRVTGRLLGNDAISPEDVVSESGPLRNVFVASFDE